MALIVVVFSPLIWFERTCLPGGLFLLLIAFVMTFTTSTNRASADSLHPAYNLIILTGISKWQLFKGYVYSELLIHLPFAVMAVLLPMLTTIYLVFGGIEPFEYMGLAIGYAVPPLWMMALMMGIAAGLAFRSSVMALTVGLTMYGLILLHWMVISTMLAWQVNNIVYDYDVEFQFRFIAEWFGLTVSIPYIFLFITLLVAYKYSGRPKHST